MRHDMEAKKASQAQRAARIGSSSPLPDLAAPICNADRDRPLMKFCCPRWPPDWPEIEQSIGDALRTGAWGRYHSANHDVLRSGIAETFSCDDVRLTCSGTAAIEISLRAAGIGPGDEVILAAFDYPGNFRCIELLGAKPVLVDVDASNFSIDPDSIGLARSPQVKAVVASHLYGHPAAIEKIRETCDAEDWVLIEDACQVPGLLIRDRPAGTFGDIATLSFGGSKPLTAGCGGAVLSNHPRWTARIDALVDRPSDAFALSSLQAAVLSPQLSRLRSMNRIRQSAADAIACAARRFPRWKVHVVTDPLVTPAHYKLAVSAPSVDERAVIVSRAKDIGLPIGGPFRSLHRSSAKRCRKPVELTDAARLSDTLFVIDHSALLIEKDRHDEMIDALALLHDHSQTPSAQG